MEAKPAMLREEEDSGGDGDASLSASGSRRLRSALMVGSASSNVARGSRQAPPWIKLGLRKLFHLTIVLGVCVCVWMMESALTHMSQYFFVAGDSVAFSSSGNSHTATFWRALSVS